MNKINLFAGYQFTSEYFKRSELEKAIMRAVTLANIDIENEQKNILFKPPDLDPGEIIYSQIIQRIKESDICLFEVSDGNSNVLFEAGIACGLGIPSILLRNTESDVPVPSDLAGVMYLRYSSTDELGVSLPSIVSQLASNISLFNNSLNANSSNFIWANGSTPEPVSLIGGEIKSASSPSDVSGIFYMQSPDVQALVEAGGNLINLCPNRKVEVMSSGIVTGRDIEGHIVLVGGPRSNSITGQVLQRLSLPWKYELGDSKLPIQKRMRSKCLISGKKKLSPQIDGETVSKDVALLAFGPNPFNMSKRFLLLSGAFTFGVMGATRAISTLRQSQRNLDFMNQLCDKLSPTDIVQLVLQIDVINGQVITPNLESSTVEVVS